MPYPSLFSLFIVVDLKSMMNRPIYYSRAYCSSNKTIYCIPTMWTKFSVPRWFFLFTRLDMCDFRMKDEYTSKLTVEGKTYNYIDVPKLAGDADYGEHCFSIIRRSIVYDHTDNSIASRLESLDLKWRMSWLTPSDRTRVVHHNWLGETLIVKLSQCLFIVMTCWLD